MSAANGNGADCGNQALQGLIYPCEFPLKMFGKNNPQFIAIVESVIAEFVPSQDWLSTKMTPSKNDNYVSYTVVIRAHNRRQLDQVCAAVTNCSQVIMAL